MLFIVVQSHHLPLIHSLLSAERQAYFRTYIIASISGIFSLFPLLFSPAGKSPDVGRCLTDHTIHRICDRSGLFYDMACSCISVNISTSLRVRNSLIRRELFPDYISQIADFAILCCAWHSWAGVFGWVHCPSSLSYLLALVKKDGRASVSSSYDDQCVLCYRYGLGVHSAIVYLLARHNLQRTT